MHRQADAALLQQGVTADQYVLLGLLAEESRLTQQELVRRASSDANTVRAMLVRLERQGLVVRKPHPTDGRAWSVSLTATGRRKQAQLWASGAAFRQKLVNAVGPRRLNSLLRDLTKIAEVMSEVEEQAGSRLTPGVNCQ
jgi:DNA-binding MarR family transcriptional regulator